MAKRECYYCLSQFEDYGRLDPTSDLVFCSSVCDLSHKGEDIDDDVQDFHCQEEYGEELEIFNRSNLPND